MRDAVLALLAVLVLVSAIWVVTLRNLFRAALSLGLVLLGVAGVFLWLEAEFLALAQILVYVGAILILIVFAIMLIPPPFTGQQGPALRAEPPTGAVKGGGMTSRTVSAVAAPHARQVLPALAGASALFVLLVATTAPLVWPAVPVSDESPTIGALGHALVGPLLLPFEVISLVFVAVIIGAIAVAGSGER